jgi:hypothetical protein
LCSDSITLKPNCCQASPPKAEVSRERGIRTHKRFPKRPNAVPSGSCICTAGGCILMYCRLFW